MLHAFNQKNVRRVLLSRKEDHTNAKDEDGVTSMVFSPLAFMTAQAAALVMQEIVGARLIEMFAGRTLLRHEIQLWPQGLLDRAWSGAGPTRCEPDFITHFEFEVGKPLILIGEMKWDWAVSRGHLQVETDRQRRAVRALYPDAHQLVLTITKRAVRELDDAVERTWVNIHGAATSLARRVPNSAQGRWGSLVAEFLSLAEQMDFQGFTAALPAAPATSPMFWKELA